MELATFPSSTGIEHAAERAADEAGSLMQLLGLNPLQLHQLMKGAVPLPTLLPLAEFYRDKEFELGLDEGDSDSDSEDEFDEDPNMLNQVLEAAEICSFNMSAKDNHEVMKLTLASFSIIADNMMQPYISFGVHCPVLVLTKIIGHRLRILVKRKLKNSTLRTSATSLCRGVLPCYPPFVSTIHHLLLINHVN